MPDDIDSAPIAAAAPTEVELAEVALDDVIFDDVALDAVVLDEGCLPPAAWTEDCWGGCQPAGAAT